MSNTKKFKKVFSGIVNRYFRSLDPNKFNSLSEYLDEVFNYSKKQLLLEFNFFDLKEDIKNINHITVNLSDIQLYTPEKEKKYLNTLELIAKKKANLKIMNDELIELYKVYDEVTAKAKGRKKEKKEVEDFKFDEKMLNAKINEVINQDELSDMQKAKNSLFMTNRYGTIHRK
jgi:hypothetical protein